MMDLITLCFVLIIFQSLANLVCDLIQTRHIARLERDLEDMKRRLP